MNAKEALPVKVICAGLADALEAQFAADAPVAAVVVALRDGKLARSLLRFVFRVAALEYAVRVGTHTADIRTIATRALESNGGSFARPREPGDD